MSNPPFPTDAAPGADGSPQRSGLRLSEADIIASARLDVLGDGTLKEALAGVPQGDTTLAAPTLADLVDGAAQLSSSMYAARLGNGTPPAEFLSGGSVPSPMPLYGDAASRSGLSNVDLRQPLLGADLTVEVSPILSALDAAERAAEDGVTPAQALEAGGARMQELAPPMPLTEPVVRPALSTLGLDAQEAAESREHGSDAPVVSEPVRRADVPLQPPLPAAAPDGIAPAISPLAGALESAKMLADANATTEALESLKRLLERRLTAPDFGFAPPSEPEPQRAPAPPPIPPAVADQYADPPARAPHPEFPAPSGEQASPTRYELPPVGPAESAAVIRAEQAPAAQAAPEEEESEHPAPPRARPAVPARNALPVVTQPRTRPSQGIDVRGFMAGFGLSLAVGVLLYLFMTGG